MGSFLTKCFISSQTIPEGIPVVVMPIARRLGKELNLTSHGKTVKARNARNYGRFSGYEFVGFKIDALADDYGRQNPVDTKFNRESLLLFFNMLKNESFHCEPQEGVDTIFDMEEILRKNKKLSAYIDQIKHNGMPSTNVKSIPWDEFTNVWESIQEADRDGLIFLRNYENKPELMHLSICLKSAYDNLKAQNKKRHLSDIEEVSIEGIEKAMKARKSAFSEFSIRQTLGLSKYSDCYNHEYNDIVYKVCDDCLGFTDKKKTTTPDKILKAYKQLTEIHEFCKFQYNMAQICISPVPIEYGSQDYHNENGKVFFNMLKEIHDATNKFIKEKYAEYEDYDESEDEEE